MPTIAGIFLYMRYRLREESLVIAVRQLVSKNLKINEVSTFFTEKLSFHEFL